MKVCDSRQSKNGTPFTVARDTLLSPCVIHMADEDPGSLVRPARALPLAVSRMT